MGWNMWLTFSPSLSLAKCSANTITTSALIRSSQFRSPGEVKVSGLNGRSPKLPSSPSWTWVHCSHIIFRGNGAENSLSTQIYRSYNFKNICAGTDLFLPWASIALRDQTYDKKGWNMQPWINVTWKIGTSFACRIHHFRTVVDLTDPPGFLQIPRHLQS